MKQRVFIIHGWADQPHNGWFPWLKKKLEADGVEVHAPAMPDTDAPLIETWVPFLRRLVCEADEHTFFVGHSIGCQAILRYIAMLPEGSKVGGIVLVAGWVTLKPAAMEDEKSQTVAIPWLQRPIHWPAIRSHVDQVACIMSDDDQFVPLDDKDVFRRELGATIIIEHHKKHLSGEDGVTVLTSAASALEKMMS